MVYDHMELNKFGQIEIGSLPNNFVYNGHYFFIQFLQFNNKIKNKNIIT
jgi:hypothetical protein